MCARARFAAGRPVSRLGACSLEQCVTESLDSFGDAAQQIGAGPAARVSNAGQAAAASATASSIWALVASRKVGASVLREVGSVAVKAVPAPG